jgi:hypothetical protein
MTKRLKKIDPLQLGKMLSVIYGLGTLIFVPFFLFAALIASFAPSSQAIPAIPMLFGMGIGFILFVPVMYAVIGFITGVIGAFIYNIVAKWIGGIEVEVE